MWAFTVCSIIVGVDERNQRMGGTMAMESSHGDKGYFKSQYIELVITFLILNQKLCFWGH